MTDVIEVTVKTLDSQNHQFNVSKDMIVKDFKDLISPKIGIPADQQRLIFRGRVLQDDKKINEYNVENNTIHVVQRPANASTTRNNDQPSRNTNERGNLEGGQGGIIITGEPGGGGRNAIIMGAIGLPNIDIQAQTGSNHFAAFSRRNSAAIRIQVGNQMLVQASNLLRRLEEDDSLTLTTSSEESSAVPVSDGVITNSDTQTQRLENNGEAGEEGPPMDIDLDDQNSIGRMISQVANAASAAALVATLRQVPTNSTTGTSSNNNIGTSNNPIGVAQISPESNSSSATTGASTTTQRPEAPRLREMALVVQDILAFQERLAPYLQFVQSTLVANRLYENVEELQSSQYVFDTVSTILHNLSHAYHALSDIMCDFSTPPDTRRLRAAAAILVEQSTVVRATIPIAVPTGMLSNNISHQSGSNVTTTISNSASNPVVTGGTATLNNPTPTSAQNSAPLNIPQMFGVAGPGGQINFGGLTQAHISLGGPGQSQMNVGAPDHSQISFGGMGQGGFSLQDLQAMLGPAMAGGMMPLFMNSNMSQQVQSGATPNNNVNLPNINQTSSVDRGTHDANRPQNSAENSSSGGNSSTNNLPQQRTPFDVLLSCNSHHENRRQRNIRPANLRQFVNVERSLPNQLTSSSNDFLLNCVDILQQSNLLAVLQPVFHDVIINYLMRGRDARNRDHLRSCAKSLAKKISPFFESFTEKMQNRNKMVVYSETYGNLITIFFTELMQLTLNSSTDSQSQYKTAVVCACDNFVRNIIAVFKECFYGDNGYLPIFVNLIMEKLFVGTTLIFQENITRNLTEYFSSLASSNISVPDSVIVYKKDTACTSTQQPVQSAPSYLPTVTTGPASRSSNESLRTGDVVPPKQPKPSPGPSSVGSFPSHSMDEDIDDLLNLTASRTPTRIQLNATGYENALRNIPSDWVDQVQQDIRQQLGMPEQPPFSPGYIALLSRKP